MIEDLWKVSQSWSDSNRGASEENELFLDVTFDSLGLNLEDVESDCLGEGSALSNSDNISFRDSGEGWGAVSGQVLVSLFESVILLHVVEVISSNDNGSLHLGRNHDSPINIIIINKTKKRRIEIANL